VGTEDFFSGGGGRGKRPGCKADYSPPSSVDVKNEWRLPPFPLYAFVASALYPFHSLKMVKLKRCRRRLGHNHERCITGGMENDFHLQRLRKTPVSNPPSTLTEYFEDSQKATVYKRLAPLPCRVLKMCMMRNFVEKWQFNLI
jgi:hypothetical protein